MKKSFILGLTLALTGLAGADPIIFDRGLPTTNLNNAAGSERSNVSWGWPDLYPDNYLAGDTFNIGGNNSYAVDTLTVWYVNSGIDVNDPGTDFSLFVGSNTAQPLDNLGASWTTSSVAYVGPQDYQGSGGTFGAITQLTFSNLGLTVAGNTDYYFTVAGITGGNLIQPLYLHASNAARSGSTQQGADDLFSAYIYDAGTVEFAGSLTSLNNGWDKASDINVQITGAIVPIPAAAPLGLLGMGLVAFMRRRKKQA